MHSVRFFRLIPLVGLTVALPLSASAGALLKNGGFDKDLAPWECDEGRIVADPANKKNSLLEVELEGGVFGLTQDFKWPTGKKELTLTFRVKASAASEESPIQWRLRLYDAQGNSSLSADGVITQRGEWITVKKIIPSPEGVITSLMLESNRGEGKLWIDYFELK